MVSHPSLQPYVWMVLGSFSFACMGTLAHELRTAFDWQLVAAARCAIPLVLVAAMALVYGVRLVFFRPAVLWMRSLAGSMSLVATFFALTRLPPSDVFTITNMFPIWVALLSWPMLGEWPGWQVWISVLCGVGGVAIIQQPHLKDGNWAVWVALSASLSTALAMLGLHRLKGIDTRAVVVHFSGVALFFALGAWIVFDHDPHPAIPSVGVLPWLELAGVGLTATIGQLLLTKAFTHGEPAKVSVVGLTQIVFVVGLDALFGRLPSWQKLLGVPLVLGPTAWIILREGKTHATELQEAEEAT